jgi:hypothetical protein
LRTTPSPRGARLRVFSFLDFDDSVVEQDAIVQERLVETQACLFIYVPKSRVRSVKNIVQYWDGGSNSLMKLFTDTHLFLNFAPAASLAW